MRVNTILVRLARKLRAMLKPEDDLLEPSWLINLFVSISRANMLVLLCHATKTTSITTPVFVLMKFKARVRIIVGCLPQPLSTSSSKIF